MDEFLIVLLCLIVNALLSAYEMAFVSVSRSELKALEKKKNPSAKKLLSLRENPERTLSIIQIGITMVGAIAAAVGGAGADETLEPYLIYRYNLTERSAEALSLLIVVLPITYLSVVIGELVPKTLALRNPTKIVLKGSTILFIADRVFSPVISVLEWSTQVILNVFFPRIKQKETEENTTIELSEFSPLHRKFMINMAEIEKKQIKDIMLPLSQTIFISKTSSIHEVHTTVITSGHTRLPVKGESTVEGILHTKEFISLKETGHFEWQKIMRDPVTVKPTDSALGILRLLQDKKNHMAMVFSHQNEWIGIVTLEDILEEIVGDIFDEDDDENVKKIFLSKIKSKIKS